MQKILITTVPYADKNHFSIGRNLRENELAEMMASFDMVIAGTEQIIAFVISRASRLKLISSIGADLDSIEQTF